MPVPLFEGYRVTPNQKDLFAHYMGGEFRGEGGKCPNCGKNLTIYLSLDLKDSRISFPDTSTCHVPLLYCLSCELSDFDFVYRIKADNAIQVLLALRSRGKKRP